MLLNAVISKSEILVLMTASLVAILDSLESDHDATRSLSLFLHLRYSSYKFNYFVYRTLLRD